MATRGLNKKKVKLKKYIKDKGKTWTIDNNSPEGKEKNLLKFCAEAIDYLENNPDIDINFFKKAKFGTVMFRKIKHLIPKNQAKNFTFLQKIVAGFLIHGAIIGLEIDIEEK